jgi:uncharacterized protein YktA (UPF0223 family)
LNEQNILSDNEVKSVTEISIDYSGIYKHFKEINSVKKEAKKIFSALGLKNALIDVSTSSYQLIKV